MAANGQKTAAAVTVKPRISIDSVAPSLKSPRTARFAEATAVYSPIDDGRSPFADPPTNHYQPQPQPADTGFTYLQPGVEMEETDSKKYIPPPPMTPLKSVLKSPGAPPRTPAGMASILSPTFREEQILEKREEQTEKEQAKDLKVKFRVRVAKIFLRGINFACSLIVLSMLAASFSVFNATKNLPPRNKLTPWATNTQTWPQIVVLVISVISLVMSIVILAAYFRGGHKRAEKVAVYYTVFTVAFFILSIIMWAVGAGILNQTKATSNSQDMWGWACKDNTRRELFQDDVSYALVCRLQDWALVCCIIEVVIETLCIIIYGIVFYRFWSKRKLRKSMAVRDRARSDLYLAQLRSQSAPNTPGFGPMSPRSGGWRPPPGHPLYVDPYSAAEQGQAAYEHEVDTPVQYPRGFASPKPFQLQPPPIKINGATPKVAQVGFATADASDDSNGNGKAPIVSVSPSPPPPPPPSAPLASPARFEVVQEHVPAAPGERQYAAVPIPGSYASPLASPGPMVAPTSFGQAVSTDERVHVQRP